MSRPSLFFHYNMNKTNQIEEKGAIYCYTAKTVGERMDALETSPYQGARNAEPTTLPIIMIEPCHQIVYLVIRINSSK